jgi:EAL domain-containing protein (putative c-di-GMP-specific phosphodiesterase class I)
MSHSTSIADLRGSQQEAARIAVLNATGILDSSPEPSYDVITRMVAKFFKADCAVIAFADQSRVWIKSYWGLRIGELPRGNSIFDMVLAKDGPVIITDVSRCPELDGFLLSPKLLGAAFFASVPVRSCDGKVLGGLTIFGREPRPELTQDELHVLENMADIVSGQLKLRSFCKTSNARLWRRSRQSSNAGTSWPRKSDLRQALEQRQLMLHYQPEISLSTRKIVGLEALLRWQHPVRGFIPPMDFISVAEESGLILPIGDWVLSETCEQIRKWCSEDARNSSLRVCVNLSASQFCREGLADHIKALLVQKSISGRQLGVELTESSLIRNKSRTLKILEDLRRLGIAILLDDFGTGFSSLNYLHTFPFDVLKIDQSFVGRITEKDQSLQIVRTIVELARTLGMDVVAEGIETPEQLRLLRRLGCRFGQGFLLSRPMSAEDVSKMLRLSGRVLPNSQSHAIVSR